MKRFARVSAISGVLLALGGCTVGPNYKRPNVSVPVQWTVEPARGTSALEPQTDQWWKSFNDATLNSLIERAASANYDLQAATARVFEARAVSGRAKSEFYPQIGASASAYRERAPYYLSSGQGKLQTVAVETNLFQAGFDMAWELDIFGRIRRESQAASADAQASEEERHNVLITILGDVGRYYTDLRGAQLRLEIANRNVTIQSDTLHLTQERAQAGLATEFDVSRAQAQLETTKASIPDLQTEIAASIHRLSVLTGQEPNALTAELTKSAALPPTPPEAPVGLPSDLLERRPDIRQAEAQLAAATARIGAAKAEYFPRFSLTGTAGRQANQLHEITLGFGNVYSIGPSITLPIFTAGRIGSNVAEKAAITQEATAKYQATILNSLEETENALTNYANEQQRRDRLQAAVDSNKVAVELAQVQYRAGLTDFLSVLDAQRELYSTEEQLAQSQTAVTTNLIALYKALGGGWESFPQQ